MYQANLTTSGDIANPQVTRFKATTLDVKVVDEQNQPVADAAPKMEIDSPDDSLGGSTMGLMKTPEGHWRCTKLIPNVALAV